MDKHEQQHQQAGSGGATLLIRHLPDALPPHTLKRLFAHYGASDLRPCMAARLRNCAFVDFPDEASAARAQSHFHRLHFLGKTLTAERARSREEDESRRSSLNAPQDHHVTKPPAAAEPIAPALGVDYPFPPHLEYAYPPPDSNIVNNVVNALIAVPRFYTQVLHLMNKMNLPAPFCAALPRPPLPSESSARNVDVASDESELESEEETEDVGSRKRKRTGAIPEPAIAKDASHKTAGVKPMVPPPSVVPLIKKKQPVLQIKIAPKAEERTKATSVEHKAKEDCSAQQGKFATRDELERGRLTPAQISSYPVFKNYTRGDPSPVLYIKNLEKDVHDEELVHVFGGFFPSLESAQTDMNIKLMQEGRMRGQAFVRFPSPEIAAEALEGAHSFMLKGKPMVIQFGRNK